MNPKLTEILNLLTEHTYKTAEQLASCVGVHKKTVRTRIKELNGILAANGALLVSKQKYGYRLQIHDSDLYQSFCSSLEENSFLMLPSSSGERISYMLEYLIHHCDYVKLDYFVEALYVSRGTITADIKKVEYLLNLYHIKLVRKPNYGIRAVGSEFDKRICMANYYLKVNPHFMKHGTLHGDLQKVSLILQSIFCKKLIRISEIAFQALAMCIYFGIKRMQLGNHVNSYDISSKTDGGKGRVEIDSKIMEVSAFVAAEIELQFQVVLSEEEVQYIAILHAGTVLSDFDLPINKNLEITHFIDDLSMQMILRVREGFQLDFLDNFDLRMSLNKHMVPFNIRILYGIPLKNPLLDNVKREFPYAYNLAAHAGTVLKEYYGAGIPEEEIGYIALLFQFALEKREKKIQKKNILIVCASGMGSSQLLIQRYRHALGKYIDQIRECTVLEVADYNFSDIDYVFTTIPLRVQIPVPVLAVSLFWAQEDFVSVHKLFGQDNTDVISRFFVPELFYPDIHLQSKEEVIRFLCHAAGEHFNIPEDFFESVMKREYLGQTDFGNLAAIPHPFTIMTEDSFVLVGILQEPVQWGHNEVQIVFLLSISKAGDKGIEDFYRLITNLLFDTEKIRQLIHEPHFNHLIELLKASDEAAQKES